MMQLYRHHLSTNMRSQKQHGRNIPDKRLAGHSTGQRNDNIVANLVRTEIRRKRNGGSMLTLP